MPSPEKFRETLAQYGVSDVIVARTEEGFGNVASKSPKRIKAEYFRQALSVMESELGVARTREIFEANSCCKSGKRLGNSREFARKNSDIGIEARLEKIRCAPYLNMGSPYIDDNGDIVVKAVSLRVGERYACACPTISRQKLQPDSKNYCFCCAGHFRFHYEIMLGCMLKTEDIVSSPLDSNGEEPCVIRFSIFE